MSTATSLPIRVGRRWDQGRASLGPLVWDTALMLYAALGVLYALYHDDRSGEPEGGSLNAVLIALALAAELALIINCVLDGAGPNICRLCLVGESGPASVVERIRRLVSCQLAGLLVLLAAGISGSVAVAYTDFGVWFASLSPPLRAGVCGAWAVLCFVAFTLITALTHRSGLPWQDRLSGTRFESRTGKSIEAEVQPWYARSVSWIALLAIGLTYSVGWRIAEVDVKELSAGFSSATKLGSAMVTPDFSVLHECAWAMVETIYLALMATTFAVPVAVVLSFLAARNIMARGVVGSTIYFVMRTIFTIVRSIEPIVWAIIFVVWVGLSPFAGMLALLVHSVAALGKLYSEQVESIDKGPVEAIRATGAGAVRTVVYAVWPQVVPPFVAFTLYRWDINVRMATIVGMVGGGGIGALLMQYQGMAHWSQVALVAWMITMVVWLMDISSARIRERMI